MRQASLPGPVSGSSQLPKHPAQTWCPPGGRGPKTLIDVPPLVCPAATQLTPHSCRLAVPARSLERLRGTHQSGPQGELGAPAQGASRTPPWDRVLTPGLSSSVTAVPGAGGRHLPGPQPRHPRDLRGLRVLLQAGRGRADQAAGLLLCHLDGGGGRAHLLVSVPIHWAWCVTCGGEVLWCPQLGEIGNTMGLTARVFLVSLVFDTPSSLPPALQPPTIGAPLLSGHILLPKHWVL